MYYKFTLFVFLMALNLSLNGQELPYNFSTTLLTYEPLTDATTLNTEGIWDDPDYEVLIGFDFPLFGTTSTNTLYFDGFVGPILRTGEAASPLIFLYGADLMDRGYNDGTSLSPILYKLEGTAPNRIFKLEYQNAGFYDELVPSGDMGTSFVNCQLLLYEGGLIEFCFGPSNIDNDVFLNGLNGPVIGLTDTYDPGTFTPDNTWYLEGEPADPAIALLTGSFEFMTELNSTPEAGRIYAFSPIDVSAVDENALANGIDVFPNPVVDQLHLKLDLEETPDQLQVRLFNALGQEVYRQNLGQQERGQITINVKQLPAGTYSVQVADGKAQYTRTIVKQ